MLTFDWQGLFRNYGNAFLPVLWPHLEQLASNPHESSQRCLCEITAGLIRGSKHWSFSKVGSRNPLRTASLQQKKHPVNISKNFHYSVCVCLCQVDRLWQLLCPLIRTALNNITVETYTDWGTCIATACVSHSAALQRN